MNIYSSDSPAVFLWIAIDSDDNNDINNAK